MKKELPYKEKGSVFNAKVKNLTLINVQDFHTSSVAFATGIASTITTEKKDFYIGQVVMVVDDRTLSGKYKNGDLAIYKGKNDFEMEDGFSQFGGPDVFEPIKSNNILEVSMKIIKQI